MKNVVITILAVLVLGLGGYLVYDKVIDKKTDEVKKPIEQTETKKENDSLLSYSYTTKCNSEEPKTYTVYGNVEEYSNIYQYIANREDISIKLGYCSDEVISEGEGPTFYKTNYYNLTNEEINKYLNEMKTKGSSKYLEGGYGPSCDSGISISYKLNDKEYTVKIGANGQILSSENMNLDGNIYKIIDLNAKEAVPYPYCYYSAGDSSETMTNILKNLK